MKTLLTFIAMFIGMMEVQAQIDYNTCEPIIISKIEYQMCDYLTSPSYYVPYSFKQPTFYNKRARDRFVISLVSGTLAVGIFSMANNHFKKGSHQYQDYNQDLYNTSLILGGVFAAISTIALTGSIHDYVKSKKYNVSLYYNNLYNTNIYGVNLAMTIK